MIKGDTRSLDYSSYIPPGVSEGLGNPTCIELQLRGHSVLAKSRVPQLTKSMRHDHCLVRAMVLKTLSPKTLKILKHKNPKP